MRVLVALLSYLFSGLEILTSVLVFPLTVICGLGLIGFTIKIARDLKAEGNFGLDSPRDLPRQRA